MIMCFLGFLCYLLTAAVSGHFLDIFLLIHIDGLSLCCRRAKSGFFRSDALMVMSNTIASYTRVEERISIKANQRFRMATVCL
jgi:hypothetical protein